MDAVTAVLNSDPPELPAAERRIPPALTRIVDRCLKKNPAGRFQSASDLAFALEGVSSQSDNAAAAVIADGETGLLQNPRAAWTIAASCALLGVLAIGTTLYLRPAAPEPFVTRLEIATPATGDAYSMTLSRDGRQLAYVANGDHGAQLWVRPLDLQAIAQPLAGTEGSNGRVLGARWPRDRLFLPRASSSSLSPDWRAACRATCRRVQSDGWSMGSGWRDPVHAVSSTIRRDVSWQPAGPVTAATHLATGQAGHHWPEFLPHGRRFLFVVSTGQPETYGVYVGFARRGVELRPASTV